MMMLVEQGAPQPRLALPIQIRTRSQIGLKSYYSLSSTMGRSVMDRAGCLWMEEGSCTQSRGDALLCGSPQTDQRCSTCPSACGTMRAMQLLRKDPSWTRMTASGPGMMLEMWHCCGSSQAAAARGARLAIRGQGRARRFAAALASLTSPQPHSARSETSTGGAAGPSHAAQPQAGLQTR